MTAERLKQPEEKEIIKVRQGEPFPLPPVDLSSVEKDYEEIELVQSFKFEIEGVGTGRIEVKREKRIFSLYNIPVKTPAGSLEPLFVELLIDSLPESELGAIRATLIFNKETFIGDPDYDEIGLELEGKAELMFDSWVDPKTEEVCRVWFPPNADILRQISFVIEKNPNSQKSSFP